MNRKRKSISIFLNLSRLMSISTLYILFFINSGCKNAISFNKETTHGKEVVLRIAPGPNNPRNSEGDFITLNDGRILFIYSHFLGTSSSDFGNAILASRYSTDKGKTWTQQDEQVVAQEGKMNVMSVSLLRLKNNEIALFYAVKNSASDCIPYMRISTDETKTWSNAIQCITDREGYFVLNNNRVIQLKNGRLIFAVAMHQSPDEPEFSSVGRLWSYYSDNNGRTWISSQEIANPNSVVTQEPGLVELKNGNIMMFIRTTAGVQYLSFSKDKGETWSTVEPSNIKSPCSPASIARIPSKGDLLMVWNNNGKNQNRTPFNIAISKDEGKSWNHIKTIENDPDGWYCYTAIHFTDKSVLLGHCAGNRPKGTGLAVTQITKLNIDWIYK